MNSVVLEGVVVSEKPYRIMRRVRHVVVLDGNAHAFDFECGIVRLGPTTKLAHNVIASNNV